MLEGPCLIGHQNLPGLRVHDPILRQDVDMRAEQPPARRAAALAGVVIPHLGEEPKKRPA
jgi:hypothetical protein